MTVLLRISPVLGLALAGFAQEIVLERVAGGLSAPTDIAAPGDGSGRLFVVQQSGIISVLKNSSLNATPFLDIRNKTAASGERGLLGLAFPPGYAQKGRFYVNYTDLNGNTVVAQYRVQANNADVADPGSESVLLSIQQPYANHNGGCLRFGPDGYLYVGMGDGGSGGDPQGNGQNRNSLLGKLLRVDVDTEPGRALIPGTNPFANTTGTRPEIWALGLRNPWRFSFDRATGNLWIADVGQDAWEEIDVQPAGSGGGENYGWNIMEGSHCYRGSCSPAGLTLPVYEYSHAEGCSITGGFVYRGAAAPGLRGTYVYGDYCSGRVWGVEKQGSLYANRVLISSTGMNVSTFGEDEFGELYVADAKSGAIYRVSGSQAARFSAAGVVNAASYTTGLAPGGLASVFASGLKDAAGVISAQTFPLPVELASVSITLDGIRAPILAVANQNGVEQANFQVPYELRGRGEAQMVVMRSGVASASAAVPILGAHPGIFTGDGVNAVAVHADGYQLATADNPLRRGEDAFLYATGLGATDHDPASGSAAPLSPLSRVVERVDLAIAGIAAEVTFAGLAPKLAGVYQINFRVPAGVAAGSQAVRLTVGGTADAAVANVFVQ